MSFNIKVKKGLALPLSCHLNRTLQNLAKPQYVSLNLTPFDQLAFKVLVKQNDRVKIGTPLIQHKGSGNQIFVSPASGTIKDILRGEKRILRDIVIAVDDEERVEEHKGIDLKNASRNELLDFFLKTGLFAHIRKRPFDQLASPKHLPKAIFIKCLESLPYVPPAEMQVQNEEENFEIGLSALKRFSEVFLVHDKKTAFKTFVEAKGVEKIAMEGPHPISNLSIPIHHLCPINHAEDYVWTVSALDVVIIGKMVSRGHYHVEKVVSLAGEGVFEEMRGFYKTRQGVPINSLIENRVEEDSCLISGDPLCGKKVTNVDFLHYNHTSCTVLKENKKRELFHFLRLGTKKYSSHRAYFSFFNKMSSFTTNLHGEERAFIDGSIYDKVMPMKIPTMHLIKAILAEDFDLSVQLGLLEVVPEDFALPTFICPSKIEMMEIVKKGIDSFSREL